MNTTKPCPCGSGQDFANCHGQPAAATQESRPSNIQMQIPFGGVPGQVQNYVVVAGTDPKGAAGKYRVIFTLSRDGHLLAPRTNVPFEPDLPGDSHVLLPPAPDAARGGSKFMSFRVFETTPRGRFEFVGVPNDAGHLARVESEPFNAE